jgi:DNA-binding HxlR family transcriptional regulator
MEVTDIASTVVRKYGPAPQVCNALVRIGDKWSVLVIARLGERGRRFTELLHDIDGISQRMLTVTLRRLERDGLLSRTVHPVVPPRVDYALTPMGKTLLTTVTDLARWAERHTKDIESSRTAYDKRQGG